MYKIGLSSMGYDLTEENFKSLKKAGIEAIEISMEPDKYKDIDYKKVKGLSERYGVELWSYHLPFYPIEIYNIASCDKETRKSTLSAYSEFIKKASDIGIDKFIVHPGGEVNDEETREERIKCSMDSLSALAEEAERNGAKIAVEDLPRACLGNTSDEMIRLLEADERLGVCFDTNHLLKGTHEEFFKKLGDKIITCHISDYDFVNERHWLPGEGKINWKEVYGGFQKAGYNGVWMYEISLETPESVERGELCFADFAQNANAIFNGEPIPKIRKIKENIGFWD